MSEKKGRQEQDRELPSKALALLKRPACRKYVRFAGGKTFLFPTLASPDGRILALALEEEHTEPGRALVDALWFSRPVCVILDDGKERMGLQMEVYRCHIAGPLFLKKLLEVRAEDPEQDMASAWELRFLKEETVMEAPEAASIEKARNPEWHLDHPALHR